MRSLEEPEAPRGRGLLWILLGIAMLGGLAVWYVADRSAPTGRPVSPSTTAPTSDAPPSSNVPPSSTERNAPATDTRTPVERAARSTVPARPTPPPATPPPAARELRVTSDVPGAYVFLDRKFLGTTPLTSRDVTPGPHQLNVQVEGRPPVVRSVDITPEGVTDIAVTLPAAASTPAAAAALAAEVAVVHQHAVGSCEGTLRASGDGLRYQTTHKDAFSLPFAQVETFAIAYTEKRLRLKQRGGRTWNFTTTADTADPLFVFHRDVDAARPR